MGTDSATRMGRAANEWLGDVRSRCSITCLARAAFAISSALGRFFDAVNPRFANARPIADVSVFSRQATVLMSPSPIRSLAHPVAAGVRDFSVRYTLARN